MHNMEARERQRKTPQIVEDGAASGLDGGGIDCHTHTGEKLTVEDLLSEGQMDADGVEAVAPHRFEYRVLIHSCTLLSAGNLSWSRDRSSCVRGQKAE